MKIRKLTIEIEVDQEKADWHWIYDVMKGVPMNGFIDLVAISNDHTSSKMSEALICAHNEGLLDRSRSAFDMEEP